MQLLYSSMSPFARKVRVVAHELGLTERLALTLIDPWTDEALRADNPLSKVPTLRTDDGLTLYDSPVLCDYLDVLGGGGVIPAAGPERWRALTVQALADGLGDAAVRLVRERQRPEAERHADLVVRQTAALTAGLDVLEADVPIGARFQIGEIAVAAQLAYFDGRAVIDWRPGRPRLAAWFEAASRRESMVVTAPRQA
ncbi:MAG: Glutathione S-transferase domain [Caulobacter sp.]|nr:Glutathione S-transferase domain [Caulobacter sp.]